jgi:hypothetical protein
VLALANLVVIPLVLIVSSRFSAMWSRSETDLMVVE